METLTEFGIGLLLAVPEWVVIEYSLHRWLMHVRRPGWLRAWHTAHAIGHHGKWRRQFSRADADYAGERDPSYGVLKSAPVWLAVGLLASWPLALAFAAVGYLHGVGWRAVHREMHAPTGAWWTRTWWYRLICAHHEQHHRNPRTNYSVLFAPLGDWVFGTRKP